MDVLDSVLNAVVLGAVGILLTALNVGTRREVSALRREMAELRAELREEIREERAENRQEHAELRSHLMRLALVLAGEEPRPPLSSA